MIENVVEKPRVVLEKRLDVSPNDCIGEMMSQSACQVRIVRSVSIILEKVLSDLEISDAGRTLPKHVRNWSNACEELEEDDVSLRVGSMMERGMGFRDQRVRGRIGLGLEDGLGERVR